MTVQRTKADKILHLKPLSIEQRNAIDLLILGKTDEETGAAIGVTRQTVCGWRTSNLLFQSELEQARGALWRQAAERLRGMMSKALDNIAGAIESGDVKASFELLKAVGIYGDAEINHVRDWHMPALIRQQAEAQVEAEGISRDPNQLLPYLCDNPKYHERVAEIEAELWTHYGANGDDQS